MQKAIIAAFTTVLLALPAAAEVIKTPVGDQGANPLKATDLPRGSSPQQVEAAYGKPAHIAGPVGQPPITRWEYKDYTVYFERNQLLHVVTRHMPYVD